MVRCAAPTVARFPSSHCPASGPGSGRRAPRGVSDQGPFSLSSGRRDATSNRQNTVAPAVSPARTSAGFRGFWSLVAAADAGGGAASVMAAEELDDVGGVGAEDEGAATAADDDAFEDAEDPDEGIDIEDADVGAPLSA